MVLARILWHQALSMLQQDVNPQLQNPGVKIPAFLACLLLQDPAEASCNLGDKSKLNEWLTNPCLCEQCQFTSVRLDYFCSLTRHSSCVWPSTT